jgi:hypothetical protein
MATLQEATLSIASVVDSFTSVCSVNVANGAKTFHVDVVQSVVGLSISKSYVFTAKYIASGPRRQVAAITSADRTPAKMDTNDRFSSRKTFIYIGRVSGTKTEGIRVSMKVVTSAPATIVGRTVLTQPPNSKIVRW